MTLPIDEIIQGDNVTVLKNFPAESVDLVVTSPPYDNLRKYHGFEWDFEALAAELLRVAKPGGVVVWVVADATVEGTETGSSFRQALYFMRLGFNLHDTMIYQTEKPPLSHCRYEQKFEYMFVLSKGRPKTFNPIMEPSKYYGIDKRRGGEYTHRNGYKEDKRIRDGAKRSSPKPTKIKGNVWKYNTGRGHSAEEGFAFEHPATFPEELARDHIVSWSNPGDVVLDPFCGSGTTLKMAYALNRCFIGIDVSEEYCELSRRRVDSVRGKSVRAWKNGDAVPVPSDDLDEIMMLPIFATNGRAKETL